MYIHIYNTHAKYFVLSG